MKHFIFLLLAISITGGCKNAENTNEYNSLIPDISDLAMTEDLQKIFSDRRKDLVAQFDKGIVVLRSDYGYDGGRHEFRVADNFHFLTGFTQSGSVLILLAVKLHLYKLYIKEKTIREAIYTGEVTEADVIMNRYLADNVLPYQEPGQIIEKNIRSGIPVYEKYRNIGVRIEDDILITDNGNIILSKNIPKEIDEIERIMKRKSI